ncbi:hypothetical protein A2V71_02680 [Candidatus Berkelbacteria bacterium RBG_13_40_8]|uniref:Transcobalamin-like C-terminal domain-containing protein n=1 Tax=Candidatus Berkelbacteria bacterium RBG_13_40_8 TaxID=1797467 RepID=A0A1F5DN37_9BACT|nr:MAG: hypothetical protein A2V71_02680 [Candidatus Berkelbacteria bacterium RBG_13_40_8]
MAILVISLVYGSIGYAASKGEEQDKQNDLKTKIANLEELVDQNKNQSDGKIAELSEQLKAYAEQVAYYKSLPMSPKEIAGAETVKEIQYIEKPVTQIVTQTAIQGVEKNQAVVTIENLGSFQVDLKDNDNAFTILKRAGVENGFPIEYQEYSFGVFVTAIGGIKPVGNQYWAFYYNGKYSMVGASAQTISKNDTTFWKLESF